MPLDNFATKQEVQDLQRELAQIKQQNQEVIETLKSLDTSVKQGYIKVRGGEDIPKMSELTAEMNKYALYVKKRTAQIDHKLDQYGNISQAVTDESNRIVKPLVEKYIHATDTKTAFELKKNRATLITSVLASVGPFIGGVSICIISILKLL